MKKSLLFLLVFGFLISCRKEEVNLMRGNKADVDSAVSQLTIDNFINRVYITLLGRKASELEFTAERARFVPIASAKSSREALISDLQLQQEYKRNLVFRASLDLIAGVDSARILRDYQQLLIQLNDSSLVFFKPILELNKVRIERLLTLYSEFSSGAITITEVHRRLVDNPYYDDINMGTENFVVSMFQYFLDRYPSNQELSGAKSMVDGLNSSLFLQSGSGKNDFLSIFFTSLAYAEGQVHAASRQTIYRKATHLEVLNLSAKFMSDKDFAPLQGYFLSSDEYFYP